MSQVVVDASFYPHPNCVDFFCSLDGWKPHPLYFHPEKQKWVITLLGIPDGKYHCKFRINGTVWVCLDNLPKVTDHEGNQNNLLVVDSS
ncbi:hypothetical protein BLNAU_9696 [Blattamonas nauphoetae]|uniref:AMP-activated protein kinase glycogen-binding domain-containing protein n=1 Tax=Blattamonas nauphoetae TaxID=2049346 RepID=A0ABQ9XUZ9_9EUKA|nr:hypothetical protein BLNAU_9696 [Blattamonas nauphoetae]